MIRRVLDRLRRRRVVYFELGSPSCSGDAATKGYVDATTWPVSPPLLWTDWGWVE